MLDEFGLYPISLRIDLSSYDGPSAHVARFRRQAGWIWVGDAVIRTFGEPDRRYSLALGCLEDGTPIPEFMVPNLLACACSLPLECTEVPMEELDDLIDETRGPVLKRWLRETDKAYAALHADISRRKAQLEARAKRAAHESDRMIADLRRRRRTFGTTREQAEAIDAVIESIEREQLEIEQWLADQLRTLRLAYAEAEETSLRASRPRIAMHMDYCIHWRDTSGPPSATQALIDEMIASTRYFGPEPPRRPKPQQAMLFEADEECVEAENEPSTE